MKKTALLLLLTIATAFCTDIYAQPDTSSAPDRRVERLLGQLTLDEKLSLMVHQNPAIPRVGLPAYSWWNEALHGVGRAGLAEVYPMPIALAATFDPEAVGKAFARIAAEARRKHRQAADTGYRGDYSGLTFFTPNINIFRDPRWGRGMETYGECPYLTARMGLACVEGLQGGGTAACLKHLAVHSGPEGIRHEFDSRVGDRDLRTTYLPAFEYIVRRGDVAQVMCGYNRLNGEPCCTNRMLFDILRREWRYDGILVTDCWALNDAYEQDTVIPRHRTHATAAEAYGDAFGREVDLECGSGLPALRQAVEQGLLPESKVDEHVRRLLRVRLALEQPPAPTPSTAATPREMASRSLVLLKNNGLLPLHRGDSLRLGGPNAWDSLMPLGNYNGTPRHTVTLGEGLSNGGFRIMNHEPQSAATGPQVVVYCGGISPQLEGEELQVEQEGFYRGDRTRIELPRQQVADLRRLKAEGHRVVLVLCTGSAIALEEVEDCCDAILVAWYGGQDMGTAVADALLGLTDRFGRLPVTFYRATDQLPPFDDYDMHRRTYRYLDPDQALFPFGSGYSYSFFSIREPAFDEATLTLRGKVSLCNTDAPLAPVHGTVVQIYVKQDDDEEGPVKQLVGLLPCALTEEQGLLDFSLGLDPFWLRRFDPASGLMEEPADGTAMTLQVGFSSRDNDLIDLPFIYHNRK